VEAVFCVSGRLYLKRGKGGERMSILEEIKEAERTAAEAKRDTKMTAREMMREAEEDAGKEAEKMLNNARAAAKDTIAAAEEEAKARAKALIGYNNKNKSISLTRKQGDFPEGYLPAIIKYDDSDISMYPMLEDKYKNASIPTKIEYIYYLMAKEIGITMSPCELVEHEGRSHFLTYRFDRRENTRFHMHSFSGLMHLNPEETEHSYTDLLRVAQKLNLSQGNKEEIVKVILFNAIFSTISVQGYSL